MRFGQNQRWDLTPAQARQFQMEASRRVIVRDDMAAFVMPRRIAAVDVGYDRPTDMCAASLVVWETASGRAVETLSHIQPSTYPYVPGLLSFREIPALLPLFERLEDTPDLVLCDGQGLAHPRRLGLASHLGLILNVPTLGWAKSRLTGVWEGLALEAGAAVELWDGEEQIGWVLRSRAGCRPTFVSPGHRVSMARSLEIARALMGRHRLCEPARRAHQATRDAMSVFKARGV